MHANAIAIAMADCRLCLLVVFSLVLGSGSAQDLWNGVLSDATHLLSPLDLVTHGLRGLPRHTNTNSRSTANVGIHHESEGQEQEREPELNPYIFERHTFTKRVESEAGEIRGLPNFRERTAHGTLKSLEDYEVAFVSLEPNSVFLPHYLDADLILDVFQGRGRISWVQGKGKGNQLQERDLEYGDFLGLPAGTVFYLTNTDAAQSLRLYNLLYTGPSSNHAHAPQSYYVAGGQNPSTVYSGFSWSTLQAAFNRNEEQLGRVLGEQTKGPIVYVKKEQMQKLNGDYSARRWNRGWGTSLTEEEQQIKPFNIVKKKPDFSNNNGWLTEAGGHDYSVFQRHGIAVSLWSLTAGSMVAPHWNSEAVKVGFVLQGEGTLEISSPRKEGDGTSYEKVQGRLKIGDVFIVPAGFPSSQIASPTGRFEFVFYEINAGHNRRHFLAGRNSIVRDVSKEILEVSYGAAWKDISALLDAQKDQVILRGPPQELQLHEDGKHNST